MCTLQPPTYAVGAPLGMSCVHLRACVLQKPDSPEKKGNLTLWRRGAYSGTEDQAEVGGSPPGVEGDARSAAPPAKALASPAPRVLPRSKHTQSTRRRRNW